MLLVDAKAALERLQSAQDAQTNLDEARALVSQHKLLAEKQLKLQTLAAHTQLLRAAGVPLSDSVDFSATRKTIAHLRDRFEAQPKASTLTQGKHWSGLLEALETATATLTANLRQDWQRYFMDRLFAGLPPESRRIGVAPIPENKAALDQYTRLYEQFARYRNTVPVTQEALDTVHTLSEKLAQITFVENVPKAVEAFVNAIGNGASLRLLTAEVLDWLREKELLDSYVVRART